MRFDALLFDFDGLILDTETPDYQSWCELFEAHGSSLPLAVWAHAVGAPSGTFDECAYLESQLGRPLDKAAVRHQRETRFHALVAAEPLRAGVLEVLDEAQELGLRIGIASSADRNWIEKHLVERGIRPYFEVIRCRDDVRQAKPHPEVYMAAAAALSIAVERVLVFEDSPHGIRAAKRAGMVCVAIPNAVTQQLDLGEADLILPSLAETSLRTVMACVPS